MSLKVVPARVRLHLYLHWAGMVAAGLGVVGFFLSYKQVGSAAQAAIDVHRQVPVFAYASIFIWVAGLALMWYTRRRIDSAVKARLAENCDALLIDDCDEPPAEPGTDLTVNAPIGRDA